MAEQAYVNGEFVDLDKASVSILDRGFLFADGVYEVSSIVDGKLVDNDNHLRRLHRSLDALLIEIPWSDDDIRSAQIGLIDRNNVTEGMIYLQITRGAAPRDFAFPPDAAPTIVMFTRAYPVVANPKAEAGIKVITIDEIRWKRRDIKSVALLAQALGKQQGVEAGAGEAWMVEDGYITEGTSSNAYIVTADNTIVTRAPSHEILRGITREAVLTLVKENGLTLDERPFSPQEAYDAAEAFITSATTFVLPVVDVDGHQIGDGKPGGVTRRLREIYVEFARSAQ